MLTVSSLWWRSIISRTARATPQQSLRISFTSLADRVQLCGPHLGFSSCMLPGSVYPKRALVAIYTNRRIQNELVFKLFDEFSNGLSLIRLHNDYVNILMLWIARSWIISLCPCFYSSCFFIYKSQKVWSEPLELRNPKHFETFGWIRRRVGLGRSETKRCSRAHSEASNAYAALLCCS